jgi:hypothetical protein
MLGTSLFGSVLRTRVAPLAVLLALLVALATVLVAAATHRRIRSRISLQLAAALGLALAGVPIEVAAGASVETSVAGALLRSVVFVASVLLVRAALAASGKDGKRRSSRFYAAAAALGCAGAAWFGAAHLLAETLGCALAAASALILALWHPTAKDLKPLGLYMSSLTLAAALVPFPQ